MKNLALIVMINVVVCSTSPVFAMESDLKDGNSSALKPKYLGSRSAAHTLTKEQVDELEEFLFPSKSLQAPILGSPTTQFGIKKTEEFLLPILANTPLKGSHNPITPNSQKNKRKFDIIIPHKVGSAKLDSNSSEEEKKGLKQEQKLSPEKELLRSPRTGSLKRSSDERRLSQKVFSPGPRESSRSPRIGSSERNLKTEDSKILSFESPRKNGSDKVRRDSKAAMKTKDSLIRSSREENNESLGTSGTSSTTRRTSSEPIKIVSPLPKDKKRSKDSSSSSPRSLGGESLVEREILNSQELEKSPRRKLQKQKTVSPRDPSTTTTRRKLEKNNTTIPISKQPISPRHPSTKQDEKNSHPIVYSL